MRRSFSSGWSLGTERKGARLDFTSRLVQAQDKQRKNSETSGGGVEGRMKPDQRKPATVLIKRNKESVSRADLSKDLFRIPTAGPRSIMVGMFYWENIFGIHINRMSLSKCRDMLCFFSEGICLRTTGLKIILHLSLSLSIISTEDTSTLWKSSNMGNMQV